MGGCIGAGDNDEEVREMQRTSAFLESERFFAALFSDRFIKRDPYTRGCLRPSSIFVKNRPLPRFDRIETPRQLTRVHNDQFTRLDVEGDRERKIMRYKIGHFRPCSTCSKGGGLPIIGF